MTSNPLDGKRKAIATVTERPSLRAYNASSKKIFRFADKNDKNWSAFNPSIAKNPAGEIAMVVRSSNYLLGVIQAYSTLTTGLDITNRVFFAEMNSELQVTDMYELEVVGELEFTRGIEDSRLFWRDDSWYITSVILEKEHTRFARLGLFKIDLEKRQAIFIEKYDSEEFGKKPEKNWGMVANEKVKEFDFIYGPNVVYKNGKTKKLSGKKYSKLRGNTQLIPWEDGYLAVNHYMRMQTNKKMYFNPVTFESQWMDFRHYYHLFVKYDKEGRIVATSDEFVFNVTGIEFAAGIIEHNGKIVVTYGHNDAESWMVTLDVETVRDMLR